MLDNIGNLFARPYPFFPTVKSKIFMGLGFGKFVFLFLYIFKPFSTQISETNQFSYIVSFGIICMLITIFNLFVLPLFFKELFNTHKWTLGKNYLFFIVTTIMISMAIWFYNMQIMEHQNYHDILFQTILIGLIPLLIYFYTNEKRLSKQHILVVNNLSTKIKGGNKKEKYLKADITFETDLKAENFSVNINDIIYITTINDNISIFYIKNNKLKEKLLHTSLNNTEKQIEAFESLIRCHRSFIINTRYVKEIKGNARGFYLKLSHADIEIPVPRSFPKELLYTLMG